MMLFPFLDPALPRMPRRLTFLRSSAALAGGWLLLLAAFGLYSATSHRQALEQEVSESGRALQRAISQRVRHGELVVQVARRVKGQSFGVRLG